MDPRILLLLQLALVSMASGNLVLNVENKFKGSQHSLRDFKAHDARRHLSVLDLPLGGNGFPSKTGLYFTQIGLGKKNFYVQIDTGSDLLWVNCAKCQNCPTHSGLGLDLTMYDPKSSNSAKMLTCDDEFCISTPNSQVRDCQSGFSCPYSIQYGDGSKTSGYFVKDNIRLNQVSGNSQTSSITDDVDPLIVHVIMRILEFEDSHQEYDLLSLKNHGEMDSVYSWCGAKQTGGLSLADDALDGILGLGHANTSMISQLAAAGKAKKMFAHCLDTNRGGGIFTIGEMVEPEISTIPIIPNRKHYSVVLKGIKVGGQVLKITEETSDSGNDREAVIDSGTTLAYLPDDIYEALIDKILSGAGAVKFSSSEDSFLCFNFDGDSASILNIFPTVEFIFENSLTLTVQPSAYLFPLRENMLCTCWQPSGIKSENGKSMILLGDMMLSNKFVVYDLENQAIGWTNYNCSSSTRVKDENGDVQTINSQNIYSAAGQNCGMTITSLLLFVLIIMLFDFVC